MPATTGIFNGTALNIYILDGGTYKAIAHAQSCEISFTHSLRETTSKDSGGDTERLPGKRDWSMTVEALFALDYATATKRGVNELFDALKAGTPLTARFTNENSGDKRFQGTVYLTDLAVNAGVEENASFNASFAGSGAITFTTI